MSFTNDKFNVLQKQIAMLSLTVAALKLQIGEMSNEIETLKYGSPASSDGTNRKDYIMVNQVSDDYVSDDEYYSDDDVPQTPIHIIDNKAFEEAINSGRVSVPFEYTFSKEDHKKSIQELDKRIPLHLEEL
jgi:hypothetical protein